MASIQLPNCTTQNFGEVLNRNPYNAPEQKISSKTSDHPRRNALLATPVEGTDPTLILSMDCLTRFKPIGV